MQEHKVRVGLLVTNTGRAWGGVDEGRGIFKWKVRIRSLENCGGIRPGRVEPARPTELTTSRTKAP